MNDLLTSVLTDASARNAQSATAIALQASDSFAPWQV